MVLLTVRSENVFPGRKGSAISDYIVQMQHQELAAVAILLFDSCFHGKNRLRMRVARGTRHDCPTSVGAKSTYSTLVFIINKW